jgi:type IV pilus assembly protein PilW
MKNHRSILSNLKQTTQTPLHGKDKGFTMLELLVAVTVGSLVLFAISTVYLSLSRSYTTQNAAANVQQMARAGIDYMVEDIVLAGLNPEDTGGFGVQSASSTAMHFTLDRNMNGDQDTTNSEDITYSYDPTANQLDQCLNTLFGTASCSVLLNNVTNVTFEYLDWNGNDLGDPVVAADLDNIRTVIISMSVQEPAGRDGTVTRTYSTRIRCRNLGV